MSSTIGGTAPAFRTMPSWQFPSPLARQRGSRRCLRFHPARLSPAQARIMDMRALEAVHCQLEPPEPGGAAIDAQVIQTINAAGIRLGAHAAGVLQRLQRPSPAGGDAQLKIKISSNIETPSPGDDQTAERPIDRAIAPAQLTRLRSPAPPQRQPPRVSFFICQTKSAKDHRACPLPQAGL